METLHEDELEEVDELIEKGIEEDGNRPEIAEE